MAEAKIAVASTIVIPNAPSNSNRNTSPISTHRSSSLSLKRRDSSPPPASDINKRARVSDNDRARTSRLFGSVLGQLGKSSVDNRAKKRMEVEAKMAERAMKQEEEEVRKKKEAEERRGREKKEFAEVADKIRRTNERATANFLKTRAEPPLFYLPWKLLPAQKSAIKRQVAKYPPSPSHKRNSISPERSTSNPRHRSKSRSPVRDEHKPALEKEEEEGADIVLEDASADGKTQDSEKDQEPVVEEIKAEEAKEDAETEVDGDGGIGHQVKVDMGDNDEDIVVEY